MEVVARALAGDREAWSEIWDEYGPRLHAYARRLLSSPYDVDDVVADTFVSAAEHLAELRDPAALRPWLYAICRRHVQRRWEGRDRVRPVDDDTLSRVVDAQEHAVTGSPGLDAAEATALLWAAADGLGPEDRELLSLVLSVDLDSGEVAAVTGQAASAVYVRISRLKDGLGRAAGALLVARHHRADCADLDLLLRDWDGGYSALWRKRIARHVDGCDVCGRSRTAAASALFSVAGVAPLLLLPELRQRCLDGIGSPELEPVSFEAGWPVPEPWVRRRRRLAVPVLGALVVAGLVVAGVVLREEPLPAAAPAATTLPTPAAASPPPTGAPRSASPSPSAAPAPTPSARPTAAPTAAAPAPTTAAPLPPAPTVRLTLSETALQTSCGSPTTSVATVTATGSGARSVVRWDGTAPGSEAFSGSGQATVGPYPSVADASGTDTVTVTATVTDALGRVVTATRTLTVAVAPC